MCHINHSIEHVNTKYIFIGWKDRPIIVRLVAGRIHGQGMSQSQREGREGKGDAHVLCWAPPKGLNGTDSVNTPISRNARPGQTGKWAYFMHIQPNGCPFWNPVEGPGRLTATKNDSCLLIAIDTLPLSEAWKMGLVWSHPVRPWSPLV